ncbi:hypothetical protein [Stenotrophomonas maltophilia]|uniref:hypothetical protein n=1 Tax=Stenotrophomonas maltophilia TaxID=40324 RepID=UPI0012B05BB2|nr:hypothetical protein [Stenotrophomonas maltophilia]QGM05601.1 hypothetical protein FEO88_12190 [Stenotrophomonas maltophilia]
MDSTVLAGVMGLVGAFIGGLATLIVGLLAVSAQKTRDAEAETTQVRATLQAIRDEVNELTQVHMASAGAIIDAASVAEPIALLYPVSAHYFTAFEANADKIGLVADDELRSQIIRTYVHFKALFDTVRLNNHFVEQLDQAESAVRASQGEREAIAREEAALHWKQTAGYAPLLKQANSRAIRSSTELVSIIDQWIELSASRV